MIPPAAASYPYRVKWSDLSFGKDPGANERRQIDQVGIAGERREALIRRVAIAGRTERTELPVFDARIGEKLEEGVDGFVERPDSKRARE